MLGFVVGGCGRDYLDFAAFAGDGRDVFFEHEGFESAENVSVSELFVCAFVMICKVYTLCGCGFGLEWVRNLSGEFIAVVFWLWFGNAVQSADFVFFVGFPKVVSAIVLGKDSLAPLVRDHQVVEVCSPHLESASLIVAYVLAAQRLLVLVAFKLAVCEESLVNPVGNHDSGEVWDLDVLRVGKYVDL